MRNQFLQSLYHINFNFKQFDKKSLFLYLLCAADKSISNIVSSYFSKVLENFDTLIAPL